MSYIPIQIYRRFEGPYYLLPHGIRIGRESRLLCSVVVSLLVAFLFYSSILMKKAGCSSEPTVKLYQTSPIHVPIAVETSNLT
jgi:hypothetical protein